jgi:hypothetical protein
MFLFIHKLMYISLILGPAPAGYPKVRIEPCQVLSHPAYPATNAQIWHSELRQGKGSILLRQVNMYGTGTGLIPNPFFLYLDSRSRY